MVREERGMDPGQGEPRGQPHSKSRTACSKRAAASTASALDRYLERTAEHLEEQLRQGDQRGFYGLLKSFELEPLRKVDTQHIRDEDGNLLRDEHQISERWVRFSDPY